MADARKMKNWLKSLALVLLLSSSPSVGYADWEDILSQIRPRITVREDYTNNLNLTSTNKIADYITTVSPGLTLYATERKETRYGVNLDYLPAFVSYAHNSQDNYVRHLGTLNAWYTFDRKLTIRLSDYFLRSDDPLEAQVSSSTPGVPYLGTQPGGSYLGTQPGYYLGAQPGAYYLGSQSGRFIYYRNTFAPSLTYQFGPEDRLDLIYVDNLYNTQNPSGEDSRSDSITPRLTYWFNIHNGITLEYGFTYGHFQTSPDFVDNRARVRYTYRFSPRTSVFGEYIFDTINYQSSGVQVSGVNSVNSVNSTTQSPSIGVTYAFSPTLSGRAQVGYFWQNPEGGGRNTGYTLDAGLNQRIERTTYDLSFQGGYTYAYFSAANLGFTRYYRGIGTITHQLAPRLFLRGLASLERDEFLDVIPANKAWLWRTSGNLSYQILRWLTASLGFYYTQNSSDQNNNDYQELRGMIQLTAGFPMGGYAAGAYPGSAFPGGAYPGSFY